MPTQGGRDGTERSDGDDAAGAHSSRPGSLLYWLGGPGLAAQLCVQRPAMCYALERAPSALRVL